MTRVRLFVGLIALASSVLVGHQASADIVQWTDSEGVIHFSNRPDARGKVVIKGGGSARGAAFMPQERDPARFTRYDEVIVQAASLYQIPVELVRAVIKVESDYDPRAISVSGARGLMQLMPPTADRLQVRDIDDPRENIFGGVRYLRILANTFNGDLALTVAAYNAGEEAVMRHGGIPPYAQTRDYVLKVVSFYRRYRTIPDVLEASVL